MTPEPHYSRATTAVACALGDGAAILDTARNRYFSLNATGSIVWDALPNSAEHVASLIAEKFSIDHSRALSDVSNILSEFEREGLATRAVASAG